MASGEAEPLQYTTTALRVSIHCEGCKKKVKKVLHSIEDVYKVTVDAAQHKVTVTGSVGADALVRRLHKAGKQAALWPSAAPVPVEAKKPEEEAALPTAAGEGCAKDAETKEKPPEKGEGKEKKPAKDKKADKGEAPAKPSKDEKADKGEAPAKPSKDKKADKGEASVKPSKDEASKDGDAIAEPNKEAQKGSPAPGKQQDTAEEAGADEPSGGGKKGKKNKKSNKPMDGGDGEAPASAAAAPSEKPAPPQASPGPERPHGGAFPYYAAQPVLSYNVAHPSSSVSYSYYAPAAVVPMHPVPPPPPQMVPYGFPPMVPAEFLYGPPGMRSSPPQEPYYYNGMLNEDNANSCSLM